MPKGSLTTQYIGRIVVDQLSKMAATIIGSSLHHMHLVFSRYCFFQSRQDKFISQNCDIESF